MVAFDEETFFNNLGLDVDYDNPIPYNKEKAKQEAKNSLLAFRLKVRLHDYRSLTLVNKQEGLLMAIEWLCTKLYIDWIPFKLQWALFRGFVDWWTWDKTCQSLKRFFGIR